MTQSDIILALMQNQGRAQQDPHYPAWHLAPVSGLLNDPNGFIHHKGLYHLFYQWNPLGCKHQHKCWGHWHSTDLVNWSHLPIALIPSEDFDRDGCYSGSAVNDNGKLTLCYTGNVKYADGTRTAWQCLAVENSEGGFDKTAPILGLPEGYSGHVRDPKVWQHNGCWYMVLGARDLEDKGKVLLYQANNLYQWTLCGELTGSNLNGLGDMGYMWECPDLFELDGQWILLCCPQGIARETNRYLNSHPSTYLIGQFDYHTLTYHHETLLYELDAGFEFYAPQTCLDADGRRLLFGWMGVPDGEELLQPSIANGWIHQMTCPRELHIRNGRLYQQPVKELQLLRGDHLHWSGEGNNAPILATESLEVLIKFDGPLTLDFSEQLIFTYDGEIVRLSRPSLENGEWLHRYWQGEVNQLQILIDRSSVEIFINDGAGVMSSRYFPQQGSTLVFSGGSFVQLDYWQLTAATVQ